MHTATLQLSSEASPLKHCGKIVRRSSRCLIWNLQAGVLGGLTPSSTRWATFHPSSSAFLQFWYESSVFGCQYPGPMGDLVNP